MSDFVEKLSLAEKAMEDIYCAKIDRELIASLHEQMRAEERSSRVSDQSGSEASTKDE
jgi:hypothetical protein